MFILKSYFVGFNSSFCRNLRVRLIVSFAHPFSRKPYFVIMKDVLRCSMMGLMYFLVLPVSLKLLPHISSAMSNASVFVR